MTLTHLKALESEAIHILREGVAEAKRPVLLFSGGKDSTVLAYLAAKAFFPASPPMPLLHVDSTWEFQDVLDFRDQFATKHGFDLRVHSNEWGREQKLNPIDHGDSYTSIMRTDALKQALNDGKYDVVFGGARRDEEATRAKERVVSMRNRDHSWDPKNQRPELWRSYNFQREADQSFRVFPLSNWTEEDLWTYILAEEIDVCPLYLAHKRPVAQVGGVLIVVDNKAAAEAWGFPVVEEKQVRFRSLGCWPVTAAVESDAATLTDVVSQTIGSRTSERSGRVSDSGSLERQKRQGYF